MITQTTGQHGVEVTTMADDILIFGGSGNPKLTRKICEYLHVQPGAGEVLRFSDGNLFVRVKETVRGRRVYLVQSTVFPANDNFMELLFWIDALKRASAESVTVVMPFFSYAKGDKKDEPRVSIRARVCADSIEAAGVDRVLTMDLHSPQIQDFFHQPVDHLYAMPVICEYFRSKKIPDLAVASTDVGFGKQASRYAELPDAPVVIGNKERPDHRETARVWNVMGEVKDRNVLIVDDIAFTGGSLIAIASAVKEK